MTVKELIIELQKYRSDATVKFPDYSQATDHWDYLEFNTIFFDEENNTVKLED